MKVVIIGGVAGGASAAARLRRLDEKAEIIIFERGQYISYANCGLPYFVGGEIENRDALTLQTPESFKSRLNIDVRTNSLVTAINRGAKSVTVSSDGHSYTESYDRLILSPGAAPLRPPLSGIDSERIFTLRTIPDADALKAAAKAAKSALIIGGGFIGVEMAENLKNIGLSVTIAEAQNHLIPPLDYDMACDLHHYLESRGIELLLSSKVEKFEDTTDALIATIGGVQRSFDFAVLSVGVKPESALAADCGLSLTPRGAIVVNEKMQTSDPDIYAVGDAVIVKNFITGADAHIPLAGPANRQGRIAADQICGINSAYLGTQGSAVAKVFDMTIAVTGINESAARSVGISYDKVCTFSASHATYYPGASNLCIKLLFETPSGRILGAQLVGFDGVAKRCDVIAAVIRAGGTVSDLCELELCYAPPFSSAKDPVNMAGFVAENLLFGLVKQFYWNDVCDLPANAQKLDVRTDAEYARGHIEGTFNIPVDSLRERIGELSRETPVYVNCQSGLRSYLACRILTGLGFDCYNLSGGYRLYESVTRNLPPDLSLKHPCGVKA